MAEPETIRQGPAGDVERAAARVHDLDKLVLCRIASAVVVCIAGKSARRVRMDLVEHERGPRQRVGATRRIRGIGFARGDAAKAQVDVVLVGVCPVRQSGDADKRRRRGVRKAGARSFRVRRHGVAFVADGVRDTRAEQKGNRIR